MLTVHGTVETVNQDLNNQARQAGTHTAMPTHLSMFCSAAAADVVAIARATSKAATKRLDERRWEYILRAFAVAD